MQIEEAVANTLKQMEAYARHGKHVESIISDYQTENNAMEAIYLLGPIRIILVDPTPHLRSALRTPEPAFLPYSYAILYY